MTNSFDVFDTAILRAVYEPKDIFRLVEQKVGKDFYKKRIEAERRAQKEKPAYSIKDIYKYNIYDRKFYRRRIPKSKIN